MVSLPSGVNIHSLISNLKTISWEASDILLYYSQILTKNNNKSNILKNNNHIDPVTEADLKVNQQIIKRFNEKYKNKNWDILSEENAKFSKNNCDLNLDFLWILDPLDGTRDFLQGTLNYAMHLGLCFKQKSFLGVVLIPGRNELWIANGKEIWGERRNGTFLKPNLSKNRLLSQMTVVTSKNHRNDTLENLINKIPFKKRAIMGSVGCKIASILRGESDIYISISLPGQSAPKDWDFAAPEAILRAAGGAITNLDNEELTYISNPRNEQKGIIIASNNKQNHGYICQQIKEIIEKYDIYPIN